VVTVIAIVVVVTIVGIVVSRPSLVSLSRDRTCYTAKTTKYQKKKTETCFRDRAPAFHKKEKFL